MGAVFAASHKAADTAEDLRYIGIEGREGEPQMQFRKFEMQALRQVVVIPSVLTRPSLVGKFVDSHRCR